MERNYALKVRECFKWGETTINFGRNIESRSIIFDAEY